MNALLNKVSGIAKLDLLHAGAWPITLKLTFLLMLIAILPTFWVSYANLRTSLDDFRQSAHSHIEQTSRAVAKQTDQVLGAHRKIAQLLAEDMDVRIYMGQAVDRRAALQAAIDYQLNLMQRSNPDLSNIFLMDTSGAVVASTVNDFIGQNRGFRQYFMRAMEGRSYVSNLLSGIHTTEDGIYFSHPIHYNRERVGVAVVKLNSKAVEQILDDVPTGLTAFLVDQNSVVVYHPDAKWRFKTLRQLEPDVAMVIQEYSRFPVRELDYLNAPGLEKGLDATTSGSLDFTGPDKAGWIAGTTPSKANQWYIFVVEPQSMIEAPINALMRNTILKQCLIALVIFLVAWLLGKAFTRPILSLTSVAEQIKSGNYKSALARKDLAAVGFRRDELGALAHILKSMAEEVYRREFLLDEQVRERTSELATTNAQLAQNHALIQDELHLAREIQQAALPQRFPVDERFQLHASMNPAREMGGDFYDVYPLRDGRYGLLVADVCGKGVPAAFFMAMSSTVLREAAQLLELPHLTLEYANNLLCQRNPMEMFVTVFYAVYDPATSILQYSCAGHNPPFIRRANGNVQQLSVYHDIALGIISEMTYQENSIYLDVGDLLLLYTDGVTEAMSPENNEFGEERLIEWLRDISKGLASNAAAVSLQKTITQFVHGAEPSDDITMLLLQPRHPMLPLAQHEWRITAHLENIERLSIDITQFLNAATTQSNATMPTFQIVLCLDELLTNQIQHGMSDMKDSIIKVHIQYDETWIEMKVCDQGHYYDPFIQAPVPQLDANLKERHIGGLGVHFIKTFMDEFAVQREENTNVTTLRKRLQNTSSMVEKAII